MTLMCILISVPRHLKLCLISFNWNVGFNFKN